MAIDKLDKIEVKLKYDASIITDEEAPTKVGLIIGIIIGLISAVGMCLCIYKK